MELSLRDFISDLNFRIDDTGDLAAMVDGVWQPVLNLLLAEQDRWVDQGDVDKADSNTVDAMLGDLGNPFDVALGLDLNRRRSLVRLLVPIYLAKGTSSSIIDVVRALSGIEISRIVSPATILGWTLGVNVLSDAPPATPPVNPQLTDLAFLGASPQFQFYSFQIEVAQALTQAERDLITEIVKIVKPAHTHFLGFLEPGVGQVIDHWELGLSFLTDTGEPVLGDEVDLHGP